MYAHRLVLQEPNLGAPEVVLSEICSVASSMPFTDFRAAVAYATTAGVRTLEDRVNQASRSWEPATKRWLISIDFGRSEPNALEELANLPNSEVRIPYGSLVVRRRGFSPAVVFHPKLFAFANPAAPNLGLLVGSANLSLSGLGSGFEAVTSHVWKPRLTREQIASIRKMESELQWFERIWAWADPLSDVIDGYRRRWRRTSWRGSEDDAELAKLERGSAGALASGARAVHLATARALWVEAGNLYLNRGPALPGNQLDLSPGTRVFFGFPPTAVGVFGEVVLQCPGFLPVGRRMRLGHAQEKLNLPIPGTDGPPSYDGRILLFERQGPDSIGRQQFLLRVGGPRDLARWKRSATRFHDYTMGSGRRYGVLF